MNAKQGRERLLGHRPTSATERARQATRLWPALIAGGACGIAALPAAALELGELTVESALGQPLRASITYALNQHEQLHDYCIFLRPGSPGAGIPTISRAVLSVSNGRIVLTGATPINEPILGLNLSIDCPYTANLTRAYTVMLDPAEPAQASGRSSPPRAAERTTPAAVSAPRGRPAAAPASVAERVPIQSGTSYRVQVGDTLSGIAQRIEARPVGLWPAINEIFAANPDAFLDGDINLLKAGAVLEIPAFGGSTTAKPGQMAQNSAPVMPARPTPVAETYESYPATPTLEQSRASAPPAVSTEPVTESTPTESAASAEATSTGTETAAEANGELAAPSPAAALRPGDVIVGNDFPSGREAAASAVATPAESARPASAPARTAVVRSSETAGGWSWLVWLIGSGIAVVAGVVYLARRYKDGFGSVPVGAPAQPSRRRRRKQREEAEARLKDLAADEPDYTVEETAADGRAFALDADLGIGTGLSDSDDIDVAQDFGFSTTSDLAADLDMMIPEGAEEEPEAQPTDVIEPHLPKIHSILESEVLPNTSDDYDLSMIVDATRQNFEDTDVTEKDLFAVPVNEADSDDDTGSYTINDDIGTRLIEQDYEKEHAATQSIDADIARAALELSERMDEAEEAAVADSRMDLKALGLDFELPDEGALSDLDDTGINAELTSKLQVDLDDADLSDATVMMDGTEEGDMDVTAEMPNRARADDTSELTARMPGRNGNGRDLGEEPTAEMPRPENDVTIEMDVESGHVNTKKRIG
ncbi:MAG: LysM peptidoglycan-binding domain-containing protein [Gammaproteobacteria bacterium]|nr:LysM peptidoglycan-binding domain-containing protein [Gammaproteobacteria bacterium]MDH4254220.1 LysM peptidoglycan-binding domain-containing protein [Gammaproteobacteria bacterium]MDH5310500.1 LysM peptidoglycan-binding domain-containing protein [Gammaproteobacteria bacterium]